MKSAPTAVLTVGALFYIFLWFHFVRFTVKSNSKSFFSEKNFFLGNIG